MNYETRIREAYPHLSKSFTRLADFLLDSYLEAAFLTATELGHAVNVDATTVVRFSQQLGYPGYPELLREVRDRIRAQLIPQPERSVEDESIGAVVTRALGEMSSVLSQVQKFLNPHHLDTILGLIGKAHRIFLIPDTLAGPAASALQNALERGGFPASFVRPSPIVLARTLHRAGKHDLLIAIEVESDAQVIAKALRTAQSSGIPIAVIASAASLEAARIDCPVLVAHAQPNTDLSGFLINTIVYALIQVLRWKHPERYQNADKKIEEIAARLVLPLE